VSEAKEYELVYDLDLTRLGANVTYNTDRHQEIHKSFDRIAYLLDLQDANFRTQHLFISMDAFTDDLTKMGIPTVSSAAKFQQKITKMNVYSNVKGIVTGTNLDGGNIEFWPNDYGQENGANIANATMERYDFGDNPREAKDGYGCMQIHNHAAKQTLFAINHWKDGIRADLGIGNQTTGEPDWTFAANASTYRSMRLKVFVK
jgi:sialate O-acetylesterase